MREVNINLSGPEFTRLANNFYNSLNLDSNQFRINLDAQLFNYFFQNHEKIKEKKKIAVVCICLNPPYWEFIKRMMVGTGQAFQLYDHQFADLGAKNYFLPGHDVDYFMWSDIPKTAQEAETKIIEYLHKTNAPIDQLENIKKVAKELEEVQKIENLTIFPLEPIEWPMPTLMRYHTFLQQEETLSKYDYIFYCDVDMMFVNIVGDEILGPGLTTGTNPMYYLDKTMYPPYEPNPKSASYIPRPGEVVNENGKPRFVPYYYAGGFQGGKADKFIEAMKGCKKLIDQDLNMNYIPIWNDESAWNRYLFDHPENLIVLNPSYIYPDSLIKEYYEPRWGRSYQPKLVTLTKKFTLKQLTAQEQQQILAMGKK